VPHKPSTRTRFAALAGAALASLALTASASAASREPMAAALAALNGAGETAAASTQPDARALRAIESGAPRVGGSEAVTVSSTYYGPEQMGEVAAILRRLDHGPELERLTVYLATAAEIEQVCGATVVACYVPGRMEMVVSGEDRAIAGVPRDFAIAHEYGHHIANTQQGDLQAPLGAGTIRWATYERVCQFTRAHELFPGDQGAHYWEDPEEAFAESYAHLNEPDAGVSWQYTPLLAPTTASLTKIRADVARPWTGPTSAVWADSVTAPPASAGRRQVIGGPMAGIAGAAAVGQPSWVSTRLVRTPLDGRVSIHLQASAGADYAVILRDVGSGRPLSRARSGEGGATDISYGNCGRDSLLLEIRSLHGAGTFEATVVKP
jgi:hypothetical protein